MPLRDPIVSPRPLMASSVGSGSASDSVSSQGRPSFSLSFSSRRPTSPIEASEPGPSSRPIASSPAQSNHTGTFNFLRDVHTPESYSDTQEGIRERTTQLSDMLVSRPLTLRPPLRLRATPEENAAPTVSQILMSPPPMPAGIPKLADIPPVSPLALPEGTSTPRSLLPSYSKQSSGQNTPRALSPAAPKQSGISLLVARGRSASRSSPNSPAQSPERSISRPSRAGQHQPATPDVSLESELSEPEGPRGRTLKPIRELEVALHESSPEDMESAPLLDYEREVNGLPTSYGASNGAPAAGFGPWKKSRFRLKPLVHSVAVRVRSVASPRSVKDGLIATVACLPAVLLGLLLNILDGVSYGFIIFPPGPTFPGFGALGVSMFFVTTVVAQLVFTLTSRFAGGNGSMMIEVIPFFHLIVAEITAEVGEDNPARIVATTMIAFALSSLLTGIAFLLLGLFKLGTIIGFFPRHILVGCIGGVGVFLIVTGLEVSAGFNEDSANFDFDMIRILLTDAHKLALWVPPFVLAVVLRIITHKFQHQLIFPLYFVAIPIIFYIVIAITGIDIYTLRDQGWIFNIGATHEAWYKFYDYFDFRNTSWRALWLTIPTQLALLFFNVLHPPLNVPALAISLNDDDVDTNKELTSHGIANVLVGFLGVPPVYLTYVNSVLFYRVGGTTRYSSFLLAVATAVILVIGTAPIGFMPVMEVAALIFVLGIDLVKEAVWDTRRRVTLTEYVTILAIIVSMTVYDFVAGVLLGIVLACFFFVVQNSQRRSIRASYTGSSAMSTVRRPSAHRKYLREVGRQTHIIRLQGFLFFGTITHVEETIRRMLDIASWEHNPIRFLVVDLILVAGLDMSAAEAFVRLQRLLSARDVVLVLCGCTVDSPVGKAFQAVNLWADRGTNVEVFANLNEALEWTENVYLKAWFTGSSEQKLEAPPTKQTIVFHGGRERFPSAFTGSLTNSPRRSHLQSAGERILPKEPSPPATPTTPFINGEPMNTLMKVFSPIADVKPEFLARLIPYLKCMVILPGYVLFRQGDEPDGLYIVESGGLRATYSFADHVQTIEESMVGGTVAGELSGLSSMPRTATVIAERQSIVWKLSAEDLARLEEEQRDIGRVFLKLVLKAAMTDYDVLIEALASRQ